MGLTQLSIEDIVTLLFFPNLMYHISIFQLPAISFDYSFISGTADESKPEQVELFLKLLKFLPVHD